MKKFRVKTHYSFVPSREVPPPSAIVKVGVAKCCPHTSVFVCTCLYPLSLVPTPRAVWGRDYYPRGVMDKDHHSSTIYTAS